MDSERRIDLRELIDEHKGLEIKINEISILVREMHQRQNERTLPAVEKIEKVLYGNGKRGLLEEHSEHKSKICTLVRFMCASVSLAIASLVGVLGFIGIQLFNGFVK